jgi:molybdate transport system substrate-binding protein
LPCIILAINKKSKEDSRMRRISLKAARLLAFAALAVWSQFAAAAEIQVVSSGGFAAAYRALAPGFEQQSGQKLITAWGPSMGKTPQAIPNRIDRGEPIDVVIMVGEALDQLVAKGLVNDGRTLALSRIGVAVKAGAAKPDVSTVAALRQALLAAKSIAYSDSASGVFLSTVLFPRLGIDAQIKDKCRMIPAEPVGQVVARGEAELGFQQVSELLPVSGIDFAGVLPDEAQQITPFSAGIVATSKQSEAARALIDYLSSAAAAAAIRSTGLDPVSSP